MRRFVAYSLYVLNAAIIVGFWWSHSGPELIHAHNLAARSLTAVGDMLGLLGVYSLLWQLLLMSRLIPLEQTFGRLELAKLHHYNGDIAFFLILFHPIFLTLGYAATYKAGIIAQFLSFITSYTDVLQSFIALILIIVVVVMSVTIARKALSYEAWYYVHLTMYLAIILAFGHQLKLGSDFVSQPLFVDYWKLLYFLTASSIIWFRFYKPVALYLDQQFRVSRVVQETDAIVSIYLEGNNLNTFHYLPGQFAILRFLSLDLVLEAHPFSFSASPGVLRFTVKNLGSYTEKLQRLAVGTPVLIDGPHGRFVPERAKAQDVLLIAGGIGITPLRAMLEPLAVTKRMVTLIYAARSQADFVFQNEMAAIATQYPSVRLVYVEGQLDTATLQPLVASNPDVFLCGPVPMMDGVTATLTDLGVEHAHIFTERFAY